MLYEIQVQFFCLELYRCTWAMSGEGKRQQPTNRAKEAFRKKMKMYSMQVFLIFLEIPRMLVT